jgi:hypothetical protein
VIADGGEVATTLATLCGREPASGLAEAGRAACRRAKASAEDEAAAMAAAAALPAAITAKLTAAGFVPAALTSQSYKLYVDREAAATHRVIDWLRDGPSVLEGLPRPILQQLVLEADHWQMPLLIAQLNERLGQPDAAGEGLSSLEWTLSELHKHPKRTALCRAALEELAELCINGSHFGVRAPFRAPPTSGIQSGAEGCCVPSHIIVAVVDGAHDGALLLLLLLRRGCCRRLNCML